MQNINDMFNRVLIAAMLPDGTLPAADCKNCEYFKLPNNGGHCYMFFNHPGETCSQFSKDIK